MYTLDDYFDNSKWGNNGIFDLRLFAHIETLSHTSSF